MPCLIIVTEEQNKESRTVALGNESIIGREKSNSVYIDDQRASRQHAKITRESDGSYLLVDLGSRNGIIVNGEKVSRRKLIDKDRIVIGRTTLVYSESALASVQPSAQVASVPAETLKMASNDKTITAGPAKLTSDALQNAIQEVASTSPEDLPDGQAGKTATGTKKVTSIASGLPKGAQALKARPNDRQVGQAITSGGKVADEEPSLGKRIIVFLAFLIFFVTILLFAKEMTKRLLYNAEKSHQTKNIPSSNPPK